MERIPKNRGSNTAPFLYGALTATLFIVVVASAESIKFFSRTYKVSPQQSMLTISIPSGSIRVKAGNKPEIKVIGTLIEHRLEVTDKQNGDSVEIEVQSKRAGLAHFEVTAPQNCALDLKCLNGSIQISSIEGHIIAQTTEGEIMLNDLRSPNITAKTVTGKIQYSGVLLPKGIYNFHSVESSVDVTLPSGSMFALMATTVSGSIDLGNFQLSESTSKDKRVAGRCGKGGPSLNISTHRGQIRLHKK